MKIETEEGEVMDTEIAFEWIPPSCKKCRCFGHLEKQCPTTEVWLPKNKGIDAADTGERRDNRGAEKESHQAPKFTSEEEQSTQRPKDKFQDPAGNSKLQQKQRQLILMKLRLGVQKIYTRIHSAKFQKCFRAGEC